MKTGKWKPNNGGGVELASNFRDTSGGVIRAPNGKFVVVWYNSHHRNWLRKNRRRGCAFHRDAEVLTYDNLEGGPIYHTLKKARSIACEEDFEDDF